MFLPSKALNASAQALRQGPNTFWFLFQFEILQGQRGQKKKQLQ